MFRIYMTVNLNDEVYDCWIKDVDTKVEAEKFIKDTEWYLDRPDTICRNIWFKECM